MRHAALVIVGNEYLAERAKKAGAKKIVILPTVIDLDRYPVQDKIEASHLCIGWIGTPSTVALLRDLVPVFQQVLPEFSAKLLVVGAKDAGFEDLPVEWQEWSEESEVAAVQRMDIGVMPVRDTPFSWGKCGYKLIQYMACGKPVVASPIGINTQIVTPGYNGLLANTTEEWTNALRQLLQSAQMRNEMGKNGRLRAEQTYSLQVTAPILVNLIQSFDKQQQV